MPRPLLALILMLTCALPAYPDDKAVADAIDAFHAAASRADQPAYFGLMTEDVVFLGTDATERWHGKHR